jgi:hypothetical protein
LQTTWDGKNLDEKTLEEKNLRREKGGRDPHAPLQACCGVKRGEQSRALVHGGSGAVPVFPPALTVEKSNLFVAAMCGNMVNAEKKSVG